MNNRIKTKLSSLRGNNRKALSIFITAGYPTPDATIEIVKALEESGTDLIELGIPFSDPLADGPTIQHSSDIAIKNGVTLTTVLDIAGSIRKQSEIPLILMGYINPVMAYGIEKFMQKSYEIGVDGLIIPDIPVEESDEYRSAALQYNLSPIFLTAPTTPDDRLEEIDNASEGFVYCVSLTGVTGRENGLPDNLKEYLGRCKNRIRKNPILVGFGISSGEDAGNIARYSDGVIVGSALIKRIEQNKDKDYIHSIRAFIKELRQGLDN